MKDKHKNGRATSSTATNGPAADQAAVPGRKEHQVDRKGKKIPREFWLINYSDGLQDELQEDGSNLKLPANIGHINFAELIEDLEAELCECSSYELYGLQAAEGQGLACVKLVGWLLENGRI